MIISRDIKPERQFYRLGALIVGELSKTSNKTVKLFDIYEQLNSTEAVSMNAFILTLDWLYLLEAITCDKGHIRRCF